MLHSQRTQRAAVTLPGIHDMFPDLRRYPDNVPYRPPESASQVYNSSPHHDHRTPSAYVPSYGYEAQSQYRPSPSVLRSGGVPPSDPRHARSPSDPYRLQAPRHLPSPAPEPATGGRHHPPTSPHVPQHQGYSFDVLRHHPGRSSLEHVASPNLIRHARSSSASHRSSRSAVDLGIPQPVANGSAPAFRVSVPAPADRPVTRGGHQDTRDGNCMIYGTHHPGSGPPPPQGQPHQPPNGAPATFQFHVAGSPASYTVTSNGTRKAHSRKNDVHAPPGVPGPEDDKGKKHECPHCSKRFNRPSSLRIHVNTHTGLKPFECPFPRCGRQFNVNSNMRRHYRNHIRAGASPLEPYQDPHGGLPPHGSPFAGSAANSPPGVPYPIDWGHERGRRGDRLWESLDDGDGSEDEEMDELQEDDEEYRHDDTESISSSSPPPVSPHAGQRYIPSTDPRAVPRQGMPASMLFSPSPSPQPHPPLRSNYAAYGRTPSSPTFARSYRDPNVSTTLRPAFTRRFKRDGM